MFCLRLSLELLLATNKNKNISTVLPPPQSFFKQLIQPFVYLLSTSHIVLLSFTTQNVSLTSSNPKRVSYFFLSSQVNFCFRKKGGWGLGLEVIKSRNRERRGERGGFPTGKEGEGQGWRPISDIIHVILALKPNLQTKTTFLKKAFIHLAS